MTVMHGDGDVVWSVALLAISIIGYFLPTLIAVLRRHHNTLAIFATNVLLGWTFIGWVIAFIWSLTAKRKSG